MRSVVAKTIHDQWRVVLGWALFCAIWPATYVALYPSVQRMIDLPRLLAQLPPAMRALFQMTGAGIGTPAGFLNAELFSFVAPLLVLAYTVAVGSAATAGEEERGTMDLLLANPIPRWRIVIEKALAFLLATVVLGVAMWLGGAAATQAIGVDLDLGHLAAALTGVVLLGLAIGAIAMAIGAITGRRMAAAGASLMVAIAAFFLNAFGVLVDWLAPWRPLSPFYHYIGNDPLSHGLDLGHAGVLAAIAVAGVAVAIVAFEQRDLSR